VNTTLDLHGMKHAEVQRQLDVFLYRSMMSNCAQVTLVTGNSEAMKEVVRKVLSEYGLTAESSFWNTGELKVNIF
jgi:DNA-nicking Smr family endonuclease